ncbi:MAG: FAD-dependent oxidoreductase [Bacilli bacterium]|nr:FAD-dependent oxidoreductase [Bacilli bacterium]
MQDKYDVIIVGMGPSSIFCAYELTKIKSKKKILLIDKGKRVEKRICPIKDTGKCLKCKPICNIIGGFSGAGAFSDGKLLSYHLSSYNKSAKDLYIGGKDDSYIKKYYPNSKIKAVMKYVDNIYLEFGEASSLKGMERITEIHDLQEKAKKEKLSLIDVPIRHLGTEKSHELFYKLEKYLEKKVDMLFEEEIIDLIVEDKKVIGIISKNKKIYADKVILAVGVDGSSWLEQLCLKYKIKKRNGYMDIGIRYELANSTMQYVNDLLYESKIIAHSKCYNDKIRTYCQNPSGFVTPETYDNGYTLVNGHAYKDKKSNNTNLAILVSYKFSSPFHQPIEYGFNIAQKANLISGGTVIVQRFGDLLNKEKTTSQKMKKNSIKPTMESAYPYDLSYILDYRTINNLIEFIQRVDKIIPGFANNDNLMYGPEIKFYGNELIINKNFETSLKNLYSIGTGGGLTIGLMMASASGVLMARVLEEKN